MTIVMSVESSIGRQAARLKALKKIQAALSGLSEDDARQVLADIAGAAAPAGAEPGK